MSVVSGRAEDISPTKKAQVEKAFQKTVIIPSTNQQRKEEAINKCVFMIGKDRYQDLYNLVSKCY